MKQFITETMSFASGILSHISEGMVHSVYRKTINVQMGSSLVALQAAGSPLSPVSLITGLDVGEMSGLPINNRGSSIRRQRRRSSYSPNHPGSSFVLMKPPSMIRFFVTTPSPFPFQL